MAVAVYMGAVAPVAYFVVIWGILKGDIMGGFAFAVGMVLAMALGVRVAERLAVPRPCPHRAAATSS